jgi:hypothetical protein
MLDPIFTLVEHSGAVIVSDIIDGHRVSKTYYGYGITESMNLFKKEFETAPKPTREQVAALEKVTRAMCELSELWDENFNHVYEYVGEDITRDLLTVSFDEMASAWQGFRHAVTDLTNSNRKKLCANCGDTLASHNLYGCCAEPLESSLSCGNSYRKCMDCEGGYVPA